MDKKIKLMMFDLDGTLIDYDCLMSDKTQDTLINLKSKGYLLALNSGRPIHLSKASLNAYLDEDFFDYYAGCNGIEFYESKIKKYSLLNELNPSVLADIGRLFKLDVLTLGVYDGYDILINQKYADKDKENWMITHFVEPKLFDYNSFSKPYPKVIGIFNKKDREIVKKHVEKIKHPAIDFYFSSPMVMEIIPKGASKKDALDIILAKENLNNENILAFGDSANDIPMLENAKAIVMQNASNEVKERFKEFTASINDDGISEYLANEGYI